MLLFDSKFSGASLVALLFCVAASSASGDSAEELRPASGSVDLSLREDPMPELAPTRLGKILQRYYREGLGGPENWGRVESLRATGTLEVETGEFDFSAWQKKPDLIKMTLSGNQRELVLAYDGDTAWKSLSGSTADAKPMDAEEARRFIHSSRFGNHLLYPFEEGKTIRYLDTVPVDGSICHQIRVELDTGYQVDYFLDIRSYLELKVVNTDLRTELVSSLTYKDYTREVGMPIAKHVRTEENGEWVSTLTLDEVKVNQGLMPWMFGMPATDED